MDKLDCMARLNLLDINNADEIAVWGKTVPEYTVILYGNASQGVGYIHTTHRLNTVYKDYTQLLKNAIRIIPGKFKNG